MTHHATITEINSSTGGQTILKLAPDRAEVPPDRYFAEPPYGIEP
jgi:hypothetical protein